MFDLTALSSSLERDDKLIERRKELEAEGFDPKKKVTELGKHLTAAGKTMEPVYKALGELNEYRVVNGLPPLLASAPAVEEIKKHLERVLGWFPEGASGEKLADAIGVYGITALSISDLWREKGQCVIKRVGKQQNTKYLPATEADLEDIAKAVLADELEREAAKKAKASKK